MMHTTETELTEEKKRRPRRQKITLQRDILDAIAVLVSKNGFAHINLSSISQTAEVDINAILRNFGSLERLLDRYAQIFDYWYDDVVRNAELTKPAGPEELYDTILRKIIESLYKEKNMRELLFWEMSEENNTTKRVAYNRELAFENIFRSQEETFKDTGLDLEVLTGVLVAAITYLSMRRKKSLFLGIDYSLTKNKERLIKTIADIVQMYFAAVKQRKEVLDVAKNLKEKGIDTAIIAECCNIDKEMVEKL